MTDTTTEAPVTETPKDPYEVFGANRQIFEIMVPQLAATAKEHDKLAALTRIKDDSVDEEDLEAARLNNERDDAQVTKLNNAIKAAEAKIAEFKAKAHELVLEDVPQPLSAEELPKVQARVKDLRGDYNTKLSAIQTVATSLGIDLEKIGFELPSTLQNGRSVGATGKKGFSGPRIRMDKVYIDGKLIEGVNPNDKTKMSSNLSTAATHLSKVLKSKVTAVDLQTAYFNANNITDADTSKLPNDSEFEFTHGDKTFSIRAVRA